MYFYVNICPTRQIECLPYTVMNETAIQTVHIISSWGRNVWDNVGHITSNWFGFMVFTVIEQPLFKMYLHGPAMGGYGFWSGVEPATICEVISTVPAHHWEVHSLICEKLIYRRFYSYMLMGYIFVYVSSLLYGYVHILGNLINCRYPCCYRTQPRNSLLIK